MPSTVDQWQAFEDSNFVVGDSPIVLDIYGSDLHDYPIAEGYIACDGTGNILVEVSQRANEYGDQFTIKSGEVVTLGFSRAGKIRITHSGTDSAYRVVVAARVRDSRG